MRSRSGRSVFPDSPSLSSSRFFAVTLERERQPGRRRDGNIFIVAPEAIVLGEESERAILSEEKGCCEVPCERRPGLPLSLLALSKAGRDKRHVSSRLTES